MTFVYHAYGTYHNGVCNVARIVVLLQNVLSLGYTTVIIKTLLWHHMSVIAFQTIVHQLIKPNITENIIVPHYWAFVRGIHRWPTNSFLSQKTNNRKRISVSSHMSEIFMNIIYHPYETNYSSLCNV